MKSNEKKSDFPYLNKLVDQYNNNYHHYIYEKPNNAYYCVLTQRIEANHKAFKFELNGRVRITECKNIFSKGYTDDWSREVFVIDKKMLLITL